MKKFLFSTILGISVTGAATASIVSRGFFEEAMENYATNTALDLKANQSDLTALSNKIGTLPSAIYPSAWTAIPYYSEQGEIMPGDGIPLPPTLGEQLTSILNSGPNSPIDRMFRVMIGAGTFYAVGNTDPGSSNRETEFLGLNPLTQKVRSIEEIITLPSGEITPSRGLASLIPGPSSSSYPTSIRNFMTDIYTGYWSTSALADAVYLGSEYTGQKDPALVVKGLRQITDEIGDLPNGKNLAGMISETDAKIGTLPAGYDSVGAALSAIKGIAEEAKQKAEAAIPDPKAEGATGKYVLTVDIADSSAIPVYRWEKIDRALDETQSEQ